MKTADLSCKHRIGERASNWKPKCGGLGAQAVEGLERNARLKKLSADAMLDL